MRENEVIELKRTFVNDLNKEVIAFANTNGGEIYVGIDDDGTPIGLDNIQNVELQCISHINDTIKPDVSLFIKYEHVTMEGKNVLKIVVSKGSMSPYYVAGKGIRPEGVYVRQGTASVPATETTILKMIKETSGEAFEETRSLNQSLTFVAADAEFDKVGLPFGEAQKRSLGLIGRDGCYTNLALLLSDQCEHKIKFAVFEGTEKEIFRDRHEFSGSLFRQLEDLLRKIDSYNRLSSPKLDGVKRQDVRDYPDEAIREAVLNAMVHREYALGGYTLVSMFSDRLEIVTLGGLVVGVEMDDIMMGVSYLRNSRLADIFYRLHFIEAYGTGIAKINNAYKDQYVQPLFESTSNAFKIVLPKCNGTMPAKVKSVEEREAFVLDYIKNAGEVTRAELQKVMGVSQATATRLIKVLLDKGAICKNGEARNAKYSMKD